MVFLTWVVVSNMVYFHPYLGKWYEMIQSDEYFSDGLKPPPLRSFEYTGRQDTTRSIIMAAPPTPSNVPLPP